MKKQRPGKEWMVREAALAWGAEPPGGEWVSAALFKTHCLRLIEEVRQGRSQVVITRYGKPVAKLVPFEEGPPSLVGHLAGAVAAYGDLVSPLDAEWEAGG
ncbi:MAG TPA: type II toxin-antitoxin system Phd/YefM family antitoxin [Longimicrobiaceae bacterium]|nr:type II toxin-antitoxin system Phd/YefM family antitoxin [Longimicrobiaceae bacterium]